MHTYTVCIGSNCNRAENLSLAQKQLTAFFPSIRFANEEETKPFLMNNPAMFTNQVARFQSRKDREEVQALLKSIEKMAGRLPEDKVIGIVKLDIDLLICDDMILKPADIERDYVMRGISSLTPALSKGEGGRNILS